MPKIVKKCFKRVLEGRKNTINWKQQRTSGCLLGVWLNAPKSIVNNKRIKGCLLVFNYMRERVLKQETWKLYILVILPWLRCSIQEGGNSKGWEHDLVILPWLRSMLLSFCWHQWSWGVDISDIMSTRDTSFNSIMANIMSFFWESPKSVTLFLNQHLFFPFKCFIHNSFFKSKP